MNATRTFVLGCIALAAPAFCQTFSLDSYPPGPDLDHLYERVSGSDFVVRGQVASLRGVIAHFTISQENEAKYRTGEVVQAEIPPGGFLFTVTINQTICRASDFLAEAEQTQLASPVSLLVPESEPDSAPSQLTPGRRDNKEFLIPGAEYLLFLRRDPKQDENPSNFNVDPTLSFYRAFQGSRGAVRLPAPEASIKASDRATPLLAEVTAFCDAVKPGGAQPKIAALTTLKQSDPGLREAAEAAIEALEASQAPQGPPGADLH